MQGRSQASGYLKDGTIVLIAENQTKLNGIGDINNTEQYHSKSIRQIKLYMKIQASIKEADVTDVGNIMALLPTCYIQV